MAGPEFMSPLVYLLPKVSRVPSPKDVLGYRIGRSPQHPTLDPILCAELPWFSNFWMTKITRISKHMTHVGFHILNPETLHYYADILGFREFWRGSANDKTISYSNLLALEGIEYAEFLLGSTDTKAQKGSAYHIALKWS